MTNTVSLSTPIKTHDGETSLLTFRAIAARDIVAVRVPPVKFVEAGNESHTEYRYDVVMQLASRLTGVDDILLGSLSAKDFHAVSQKVLAIWNASGE
jgi:hypothetical protein